MPSSRTSPWAKARLIVEIVQTYSQARRRLRHNLPEALRALRELPPARTDRRLSYERGLWYAGVVTRTLRFLPLDDRCLTLALVLTGVLARRGMDTKFVLGVRPGEQFAAHAWLEFDGRALLPPLESEYDRLAEL